MNNKIICLGNEFIEEDSLAKKIGFELNLEGYEIINIKDSFQLMDLLSQEDCNFVILDVVKDLKEVRKLEIDEISNNQIITAHDFDAGFVLKLFKNLKVRIIGIPPAGDMNCVKNSVKALL